MTALMRWNVGVIDYLMERGVDPSVKDKFGFTAKDKAKIKQFRTIHSMLTSYEERYASQNPQFLQPVTNEDWRSKIKSSGIDFSEYERIKLWKPDNENFAKYKPSQLMKTGEYPFSNFETNSFVFSMAGNYFFFNSNDHKMIY